MQYLTFFFLASCHNSVSLTTNARTSENFKKRIVIIHPVSSSSRWQDLVATFQLKILGGHQNNQTISWMISQQSEQCQVTLWDWPQATDQADPQSRYSWRSEALLSPREPLIWEMFNILAWLPPCLQSVLHHQQPVLSGVVERRGERWCQGGAELSQPDISKNRKIF